MTTPNIILDGYSLDTEDEARRAIDAAEALICTRFTAYTMDNRTTYWTVRLCLIQGIQDQGLPPPDGYIERTGVTVAGINVTPGSAQTTYIQADINCLATRIQRSFQIIGENGEEETINAPDHVAEPGYFFCTAGTVLAPAAKVTDAPIVEELVEHLTSMQK